ncbi:putative MPP superfamily phosphohydrolase/uncharacterized integral membrane protein [Dysgonomonas sp. PH5-45]|uniref:metallophosphoesterase n=1 Tax=unclassified Dysgonomonas TaxID=2630389 RepID=UPI0024730510|nr:MULTISPECIES: metallophosphoesterase [unclassified Dysgonomonas]MDH6355904.1 putative MPP superfamily phosphohydrolase/uncharacterized integral membrane protein [Dysgonomonas sp. PH5-45]MDH6388788.1 putative MPP superfamily phosphohydrolase/uncharacterized integral membrane protein [Dysgonomonas sp. PH5-37]
MKAIFILFLLLFLGGNYYVFYRAWASMPPTPIGRIILIGFAVIAVSSLFVSFLFGDSLPVGVATLFYKIGTAWIFIFLYFFMMYLLKDIFSLVARSVHYIPDDAITRYTKENWLGFCFMIGFISLLMVCGYLKYIWKVRVEQPVAIEKTIGTTDSLRIVAISDLHLGYGIGKDELQKWVELINKEQPDVVLIAGDAIDNSLRPLLEGDFAEPFKEIKSKYGVFACLGNHEYISGVNQSMEFYKKAGIQLLKDQAVLVDSAFYIVGRDDKSNPRRKPLSHLVADVDKSKPIILIDHQPYNLEESEENGIDLQFSGHTHRGQVWPISLITDYIYEDSYGYLKKGNTNIYVSSGIGIWGGKFRIGTQSEYVVINMAKK